MKTSELQGIALDWAVAKANKCSEPRLKPETFLYVRMQGAFRFSSEWSEGGPIIEREEITIEATGDASKWCARRWDVGTLDFRPIVYGPTPLITAMRCYVASKLGVEVEIPEELR